MSGPRTRPALRPWRALGVLAMGLAGLPGSSPAAAPEGGSVQRGAYLFAAADCAGCHTDSKAKGPFLAGGAPLATDFGTFFAPNITSDRTDGLGAWTLADFRRALRSGQGLHGRYLYPVFPYTAFTGMTDGDIADLWAYLKTVPPVARPSRPQQAKVPYGFRPLLLFWRALFFREGPLKPLAGRSPQWNRGRYLAEAVVHCQECHTPRGPLGELDEARSYAGNPHGPDGQKAPNISASADGLGKWSVSDLEGLLESGETPDGDTVGSGMLQVVDGTGKLTPADRRAIAVYIKSLPARPSPKS